MRPGEKQVLCIFFLPLIVLLSAGCGSMKLENEPQRKQTPYYTAGGNYERQNYLAADLELPLQIHKKDEMGGMPNSHFVYLPDQLFLSTRNGYVYQLKNGRIDKRDKEQFADLISAPPTMHYPFLLVSSLNNDHGLAVYDLVKGKSLWKKERSFSASAPVVYRNDRIIHVTTEGRIDAYAMGDGKRLWRKRLNEAMHQHLALSGDRFYALSDNGHLFCISAEDSRTIWDKNFDQSCYASPVISGPYIFIVTYNGYLLVVNRSDGTIEHQISRSPPFFTAPATDGTIVVSGCSDGLLQAYRIKPFKKLWEKKLEGPVHLQPLINNRYVFAATAQKYLYILDKQSGGIEQTIETKRRLTTVPIIFNGSLVAAYEYKNLAILKTENRSGDAN